MRHARLESAAAQTRTLAYRTDRFYAHQVTGRARLTALAVPAIAVASLSGCGGSTISTISTVTVTAAATPARHLILG